jgi:hypothetical protein
MVDGPGSSFRGELSAAGPKPVGYRRHQSCSALERAAREHLCHSRERRETESRRQDSVTPLGRLPRRTAYWQCLHGFSVELESRNFVRS